MQTIEIRTATPRDRDALVRLGQRDSAPVPAAPQLLALQDGVVRAAISFASGEAIADPFAPTARLVELLRLHAQPAPVRRSRPWRHGRRLATA